MSEGPVVTDRLDSWKEIARYLGRTVRTVIRWEKLKGLPIHRVPGGQRQAVFAFPREVDEWLQSGCNGNGEHSLSTLAEEVQLEPVEAAPHPHSQPGQVWLRRNIGWMRWAVAAGMLFAGCGFAVHSLIVPRQIELISNVQITSDPTLKEGLVTDGKYVYFGIHREGGIILSEVSDQGGGDSFHPNSLCQRNSGKYLSRWKAAFGF